MDDIPVLEEGAEFGRINAYEPRTFVETVHCPDITFNRKMPNRPTMSEEQCLYRVSVKAACSKGCPVGQKLFESWKKAKP